MTRVVTTAILYFVVFLVKCEAQDRNYQIPLPKVQALSPKGFTVTLKDDGYSFFGFRGNINKQFTVINEGDIKHDVVKASNGKWIYKNRDVKLEIGDKIYYWIYVLKNGKGHMKTDLEYTVTGFVTEDGTSAGGEITQVPSKPQTNTPTPDQIIDQRFDTKPQTSCVEISKTKVQGLSHTCKNALLFNEEFDKTNLRQLKKWDALIQFPVEPDYPFNLYIPDDTVSLEDGSLVITPVLTDAHQKEGYLLQPLDLDVRCTGKAYTSECRQEPAGAQIIPPVTSAKLSTRRSFNFKFGRVEVRAKLPYGSWLMPEINLEPTNHVYGTNNYESGLMRIAFVRGNPGLAKKLYGGPVLSDTEPFRSKLMQEKIGIENWHNDYHNYTMVWKPDGIDLLVDGEQYGTVNPGGGFFEIARKHDVSHASYWQKGTVMAPLDQMFHLTLGLRVGGINDFDDDIEGKPWRNSATKAMLDFWMSKKTWFPSWYNGGLRVDYVRVYAL